MVITIFTDKIDDSFNIQEVSEKELNTFETIVFPITKAGFDKTLKLGKILKGIYNKEIFFYISPLVFNSLKEEDKERLRTEKIIWQISKQEEEMAKLISVVKYADKFCGNQDEIDRVFDHLGLFEILELMSKVAPINLEECSIVRKWTL